MLKAFLNRLARNRGLRQRERDDPTAAEVRRLVPKCLACNAEPISHRFALIASIPCNEETRQRVIDLLHCAKNHEWEPLKDFNEFSATEDNALVYAITGPHDGGMVVLVRDPFELYAPTEIYLEDVITAEEVGRIRTLAPPENWRDL